MRDTTVRDTAVRDTTVRDTTVRDTVVRDTVVRDTAVRDTTVRDTAVRDTAVRDTAVRDTTVRDTVVRDTVVRGTTVRALLSCGKICVANMGRCVGGFNSHPPDSLGADPSTPSVVLGPVSTDAASQLRTGLRRASMSMGDGCWGRAKLWVTLSLLSDFLPVPVSNSEYTTLRLPSASSEEEESKMFFGSTRHTDTLPNIH